MEDGGKFLLSLDAMGDTPQVDLSPPARHPTAIAISGWGQCHIDLLLGVHSLHNQGRLGDE